MNPYVVLSLTETITYVSISVICGVVIGFAGGYLWKKPQPCSPSASSSR